MTTPKARTSHYIGIDPSTRGTGIAILSVTEGSLHQQTLRIALKEDGPALLYLQCNVFKNFIRDARCHNDKIVGICIEGPSLNSTNRADALGQVRGAYNLFCMQEFWPSAYPKEVPPTSLKKFFVGNGTASKAEMKEAATARGWDVRSDDEADAAGLAELARALVDNDMVLTRKQLEAVKSIRGLMQTSRLSLAKNLITNV